jgi:hypothetical protein
MNQTDEIVAEVRAARDEYASRFNYDLEEMFKDLKAREREHPGILASLEPARPKSTAGNRE